MAFDLAVLGPRIHGILSAPGTDLATISAKRVRRQLLELDSSLTPEFVKEHKEEIDNIISSVFEQVSAEQIANEGDTDPKDEDEDEEQERTYNHHTTSSRKRKQEVDEDDPDALDDASPPPKKPKKSAKKGQELSDAQLARKLSSEINGRSTRGVKGGRAAPAPKRSRAKKSAATVDSDEGSDDDGTTKRKKKPTASGAKGGFAKEFTLSEPLSTVLQVDKLSRPQVVKQLWVYIKGNELQNPSNKREIMCDTNLRAVFGVDKIDMFKMNKVLGQHLHETE